MVFDTYTREIADDLVHKVYGILGHIEKLKRPDLDINEKVKITRGLAGMLEEFKKYKEVFAVRLIYHEAIEYMRGYTSDKALDEMLDDPDMELDDPDMRL